MNVLYTNFHLTYGGGHDTYLKNLLTNKNINAYVAVPASSNLYLALHSEPEKYNITQLYGIEFPGKLKDLSKIVDTTVRLRNIIESNNIDIVHCSGSADHRMMLYVKLLSHRPFKVVFTKHNSYPTKGIVSRWRLLGFSDAVIFVSHSIYKTIGFRISTKKREKITVIHNGIDVDRFNPVHMSARTKMAKTSIPDGIVTLVSNAGTATHKGWHYLFRAIKELPLVSQRRLRVIMVGDMPDAEIIEKLVGAMPLCEVLWTGYTAIPEQYLWLGDVGFVLSDDCETISFACREMMAAGLPVIVSDFGGTQENFTERQDGSITNGWLTKTGDINDICKVLEEILVFPVLVKDKSQYALEIAQDFFTVEKMIDETMNVYRRLG